MDILKAAVYCGTHGKYNAGSLGGGWLQLADYKDANEFLKACKGLHKDEKSPEFMYQDTEYVPKEFYSESEIYPEIFMTIQAIKSMNEEQQAAFETYCKENECIPDMFDVDEFFAAYKTKQPTRKKSINKDTEEFRQLAGDWGKDCYIEALKIQDKKFVLFSITKLEKEFCWGYGCQGLTNEEANELCKNFNEDDFRRENLNSFDSKYKYKLKCLEDYKDVTLGVEHDKQSQYGFTSYFVKALNRDQAKDTDITLTGSDAEKFKAAYKAAVEELRQDFRKRVETYLKKYGLGKIRKWTYWADE